MINGEVVEILIRVKGEYPLTRRETEAINSACNIIAKLPRTEKVGENE